MMNRPTEYRIRYQAPTSPLNFFRFAIQHRKKNIPKSNVGGLWRHHRWFAWWALVLPASSNEFHGVV